MILNFNTHFTSRMTQGVIMNIHLNMTLDNQSNSFREVFESIILYIRHSNNVIYLSRILIKCLTEVVRYIIKSASNITRNQ